MKILFASTRARAVLVAALAAGVYAGALGNGFTFDDGALALDNPWIRDPRYIPDIFTQSLWSFHSSVPQNFYRPVMHLVYMADYHLFGLDPWGFHLTKLAFHVGASVMVLLTAGAIIKKEATEATVAQKIPLIAALLFAAHPVNTDAVVNGITEVSFSFFTLVAIWLYIGDKPRIKTSALFFFLAALSKETAFALPLMLLAYDYTFKKTFALKDLLKRYAPYIFAACVYLAMRLYALGALVPSKGHTGLGVYGNVVNALTLFSGYMGKLLMPVNLNAAYVFDPVKGLLEPRGIAGVAAAAFFGVILYVLRDRPNFLRERNGAAFLGLLWIVIPLLPALYIPALGEHAFSERYLYLPCVGFVLAASIFLVRGAACVPGARAQGAALLAAVVIIATLYSAGTIQRVPVWRDNFTLWSDTVKKSPQSDWALTNLGIAYKKRGMIDKAVEHYLKALKINPASPQALVNLGNAYLERGMAGAAIEYYLRALPLAPAEPEVHVNLGAAYHLSGDLDRAIEHYRTALRLRPSLAEARSNLDKAVDSKLNLKLNSKRKARRDAQKRTKGE